MKAVILDGFGGTGNLKMNDHIKIPPVSDTQVLVRIKASGFNPIDYQMRTGASEKARLHSPILGREFSGIVEKTGKSVTSFKQGDFVYAASGSMGSNGTYTEYISVPFSILSLKPQNLTFEQAAAIPVVYLTALQIVDRLNIKKSDRVFITGAAGGVGLALIKMMVAGGYTNIIVTAGNNLSIQHLLDSGLSGDRIINYKQEDLIEQIRKLNSGNDFAICIDLVGGRMAEISALVLKLNGIYADVTALSTENSRSQLFDKGASVYNISNYAYSLYNQHDWYGNNLNRISKMLFEGRITPPLLKVFNGLSVNSVAEAHTMLENNKTNGHKLVMTIN